MHAKVQLIDVAQLHAKALLDPRWVRLTLIAVAIGFIGLFLLTPLLLVLYQAFSKGLQAYWDALIQPDTVSAIKLTLWVALISVPLNTLFGLIAAWAITRFEFPGKSILTTLIDLPNRMPGTGSDVLRPDSSKSTHFHFPVIPRYVRCVR